MRYGPLILWILVIVGFSSEQASAEQTSRFIRPLLEFLFPSASPERLEFYHAGVRKAAHFTEYAILAFFAVRAFSASSVAFLKNGRFWLAVAVVVFVAAADEFHQSFEPSRTSSPWDVVLDCVGGTTMALVYWLFKRFRRPA
jgi:VanZ family protein